MFWQNYILGFFIAVQLTYLYNCCGGVYAALTARLQCHAGWATGLGILHQISTPSRERAHGERVLLVDSIQLVRAHSVSDELKLLGERLASVRHADVRDIGAADVVALRTLLSVIWTQPVAFGLE